MAAKSTRKIVNIDEEKCNGCGNCAIACAEGALKIIDGKAKLISETYCDGLGACLGECPQGAITVEERPAAEFDEEETKKHLKTEIPAACACAGSAMRDIDIGNNPAARESKAISRLAHWPVQMTLVPPSVPFLKNADILLAADCVPFAYAAFHEDFVKDRVLLVACPKLDNFEAHKEKLTQILNAAKPRSLTVVHMEVPCCSGLVFMAKEAIKGSGVIVPLKEITVTVSGGIR